MTRSREAFPSAQSRFLCPMLKDTSLSTPPRIRSVPLRERGTGQLISKVHPHAATINLFGLERIVKYKRGLRNQRESELRRLRELMLSSMPLLNPALTLQLPVVPLAGNLKPVEDQIDAVLCAYIGAHWWFWATERLKYLRGFFPRLR